MFRTLAVGFALAIASPAFADDKDKPKPNTLTPKEIADGWVLLFDGETTFGWKIDGAAEVKDGVLIVGQDKKTTLMPTTAFGSLAAVKFEYQGRGIIQVGNKMIGVETERKSDGRWGELHYGPTFRGPALQNRGGDTWFGYPIPEVPPGLNGLPFKVVTDGESPLVLRSIKVSLPVSEKTHFNGKNLKGWKVNAADPKRMASKWEVTKGGELSLKNGPGDLVTEKEYGNFVLQLECKTLGNALNSGVFFRCIPGKYQNGYEAQIHNGFVNNDRTKPVDFGTGAIYRRVPARKVVANDKEWFTMTVVADGKHFATWVNGYQTVDWTDDRKESENPRQGYRAAKGPISLQGHDPTTDILFRNIRIAELPAK